MRLGLTPSGIAACLVFSAVALLPSEPWARSRPTGYAFEVDALGDQSGLVQLYYDTGRGLSEPESSLEPILAGKQTHLRLPLPSGRYQGLRFDLLDRSVRMTLSGARIVDGNGRTLIAFPPSRFVVGNQIRTLKAEGELLRVETEPGATDPQLWITQDGPIFIPRPSVAREYLTVLAAMVAALAAVGWARGNPRLRAGERARALGRAALASPGRSLAMASLLGVVLANAPVILGGKSLVSPSLNVALLYGQSPWLPGFQGSEEGNPHGADVGAVLWHHVPLSMIEHRALFGDGELPLWNRYDSAGLPLLGQGQSCLGDPLHLIPLIFDGAAWAWDLKYLLAKWLLGLGVGLCAWRAFRHLPTALLLAVSSSFLGFFVYRIDHPAIFGFCYAPWILYCWLAVAEATTARGAVLCLAALVGANWAEMNSGTVKEAYVLLLSLNLSGACVLLWSARPARERLRLLGGAAGAGVLFALIASPVWRTFLGALRASYTSYNAPLAFQLQPGLLVGLFDEAFYRPFQVTAYVINPSANIFVLIGLLWAVVRWRALLADRVAAALAVSCLPALALVYGVVPPGLIDRVPFLGNILHIDNTFSCALVSVFLVLSAFGWRQAWGSLGSDAGRREGLLVLALLLLVFAAYLGTAQAVVRSVYYASTWGKLVHLDPFIWGYAASLVLGAAVFIGAVQCMRRRGSASPALLLAAVAAFGAFHWRTALRWGPGFDDYVVRPTRRMDFHADSTAIDAIRGRMDTPARVVGFHNDLFPGWSMVYGLEGISGPDALMNPYYRALVDAAGVNRVWDWRYIVEPGEAAPLRPVLDALGVRYYAGYHLGDQRPGRVLAPVHSSDMDVFESPSAWPRAYFTDRVAVYADLTQYVSWLKSGDGRPFAGIEHGDWDSLSPAPQISGDLRGRTVAAARDYRLTANTTTFTVDATGPGFIVLTEAYERGNFQVTVNGRRVPYVRLNHAFKGVVVDAPGTYQVAFAYWPRGLTVSLALAAAGLLVLAVAVAGALFWRRGRRPAPA
jgi:hypothetical protein